MARDLYAQANGTLTAINWNTKGDGSGTTVAGTAIAVDDSLYVNTKSVTIAANLTVVGLYTGIGGQGVGNGGGFTLNTGLVLTANITCDPSVNAAAAAVTLGGTSTIVGKILGGGTSTYPALKVTSGTATVTGEVYGNVGNGVDISGAVNLVVNGNAFGGNNGASGTGTGIYINTSGNVTVNGSVQGGNGVNSMGLWTVNSNQITITGNATGGPVLAGTQACGVIVQGTVNKVKVNGFAVGGAGSYDSVGVQSIGNLNVVAVGGVKYGANGQAPVYGYVLFTNASGGNGTVPKNELQPGTRIGPYPVNVYGNNTYVGPYKLQQFNP